MPALYAHNKFGKLVIPKLPDEFKKIIRKYPNSFRIGLQGPDYLFFYRAFSKNKTNQIGVKLHSLDAFDFMTNALEIIKKYGTDSAEFSYILGFICHFTLDVTCHPYVHTAMEETKCGHIEIEGDFEHLLLSIDKFVPHKCPLYKLVPTDFETAMSVSAFYPEISALKAYKSLKWMRLINNFFFAPTKFKQKLIHWLMHLTMNYKSFRGHMIEYNANERCHNNSKYMYELLKSAVPVAVSLIGNFKASLEDTTKLSSQFHKNFHGESMI